MRNFALLALLLVSGLLLAEQWVIEGNRVYWAENGREISVAPHTAYGIEKVQYVNVSSVNSTGVKFNMSFVMEEQLIQGRAYYWRNVSHPFSNPIYSLRPANYTNENGTFYYNESYISGWNNGTSIYPDWDDISGSFQHSTIGSKHIYTINNVQLDNGDVHQVKFVYQTELFSSKKFDVYVHRGSPIQAYLGQTPIFVKLDPWYSGAYRYRRFVNTSLMPENVHIALNGGGGFNISGESNQIIWTKSANDLWIYYNNNSDYIVVNGSVAVPFEVESGLGTSVNTTTLWAGLSGVYHFAGSNASGLAIDSANNKNLTTNGSVTKSTGRFGNASNFSYAGTAFTNFYWGAAGYTHMPSGNNARSVIMWALPMNVSRTEGYAMMQYGGPGSGGTWDVPALTKDTFLQNYGFGGTYDTSAVTPGTWQNTLATWNFNAFTYDQANRRLFGNGALKNTAPTTGINTGNGQSMQIGASSQIYASQCFNGLIDELRIYNNTNLSTEAISGMYNNGIGTAGYGSLGVEESLDYLTLLNQIPSNLTSTSPFTQNTQISYNASNSTNLTLYYRTNSTALGNCMIHVNGTSYCDWLSSTSYSNTSTNYTWVILDNGVAPGTYNLLSYNSSHSAYALSNTQRAGKLQLYNVSGQTPYNVFEVYANGTAGTTIHVHACNVNYTTGNYHTDAACTEIGSYAANIVYNHSHGTNSFHWVVPMYINTTTQRIRGTTVAISPTMYFIIDGTASPTPSASLYYVSTVARTGASTTTTNGGTTWADVGGEFDAHLHQFTNDTYFRYYASSAPINSSVTSDLLELDPLPPSSPTITSPTETSYVRQTSSILSINYTASQAQEGRTLSYYQIYLLNPSGSLNATITANNSLNTNYTWNFTTISDGTYVIMVNAIDSSGYNGSGFSPPFTLTSNFPPRIDISLSPLGAYSDDTMTCEFTAYDNDTTPLNISWSWQVDSSVVLSYGESRAANLLKTDTKTVYQLGAYPGTVISCNASATDGISTATNASSNADVSNTAPSISGLNLLPATLTNETTPWCNFTVTEIDDQDSVNATVKWYVEGMVAETDSWILDFTSHGSTATGSSLSGGFIIGETIYCSVNLTDAYGGQTQQNSSSKSVYPPSTLDCASIDVYPTPNNISSWVYANISPDTEPYLVVWTDFNGTVWQNSTSKNFTIPSNFTSTRITARVYHPSNYTYTCSDYALVFSSKETSLQADYFAGVITDFFSSYGSIFLGIFVLGAAYAVAGTLGRTAVATAIGWAVLFVATGNPIFLYGAISALVFGGLAIYAGM